MTWAQKLQQQAKTILPKEVYDFIEGGADDERALQENVNSFKNLAIIPRVLFNVSEIDTTTTICDTALSSPVIIAPTAPHKLIHEQGELATLQAAENTHTLLVVSCMASVSLEEIAQNAKNNLWFQLHVFRNRQATENLVRRAMNAGYKALVVTVDMPILGNRERDVRNRFRIPDSCLAANLLSENLIPSTNSSNFKSKHINDLFDPALTWEDIQWLQKICHLPIFLKGILHPEDAKKALECGVSGIIVSNHGGRQFGSVVSTIQILPQIIQAINYKIPVLVDGGIRSGTDVLKALLVGAAGVLVGRPILWGLAIAGAQGAAGAINQLNRELVQAMTLCGFSSIANIYKTKGSSIVSFSRQSVY